MRQRLTPVYIIGQIVSAKHPWNDRYEVGHVIEARPGIGWYRVQFADGADDWCEL